MPTPIPPDPMPLREALRGLRHLLRNGGESLRETVSPEALPGPAADIATAVLREMGTLAARVDRVASGLARSVLGPDTPESATLRDLAARPDFAASFAAALYSALGAVLRRLGAPGAFVSEAAARRAVAAEAGAIDSVLAARLTRDLIAARVIRDAAVEDGARLPAAALQPVAIFAVMLWLQSDRPDHEDEAALESATDLALALAAEVTAACAEPAPDRLAALYARYAAHV